MYYEQFDSSVNHIKKLISNLEKQLIIYLEKGNLDNNIITNKVDQLKHLKTKLEIIILGKDELINRIRELYDYIHILEIIIDSKDFDITNQNDYNNRTFSVKEALNKKIPTNGEN